MGEQEPQTTQKGVISWENQVRHAFRQPFESLLAHLHVFENVDVQTDPYNTLELMRLRHYITEDKQVHCCHG